MSGLANHDTTQVVGGASGFRQRETCRVPNRAVCSGIGGAFRICAFGLSHLATTTSLMEARVTTATRRLRRASIAGLATIATAVAVVGSAGSALAFINGTGSAAATATSAGSNSLSIGASNQALQNLTLSFPANGSAHEYSAGEVITFTLGSTGAPAVNDLTSSSFNTASFSAAPTVSVDNGVTAPGAQVVLADSGSGSNNAFTVTFNADAPENTNTTDFTISGLKVNLGSTVTPGQTLNITAKATTPATAKPFWTSAASQTTAAIAVGTIAQLSLAASKVVVAAPSTTSVSLGTITIKDVVGSTLHAGDVIHFTLSGTSTVWTTAPTATGSPALSSAPAITGNMISFTVGSTASASGNVLTLTGGVITMPSAAAPVIGTLHDVTTGFGIDPTVQVATSLTQARLGGSDRYATGTLLYNPTFGPSATNPGTSVVLTSGANYPDALSAQFLANQLSTTTGKPVGILTTDPNALPAFTQQQLLQHSSSFVGIDTVYIVGGTAAVSQNVQNAVSALHVGGNSSNSTINVVRVSGADRYATNAAVDLYSGVTSPGLAYVAVGSNFADALAIGPVVYKTGAPLVLTDGASLTPSAASTLQNMGVSNVIIVGGTAAVSTAVETAITNLGITVKYRIAGADRTSTAADVATYETTASTSTALSASGSYSALAGLGTFNVTNVYLGRGDNFADALVAGPVAGAASQPILLTANPTTLGAGAPDFLSGTAPGDVTKVTALGLTSAISAATLSAAAASVS